MTFRIIQKNKNKENNKKSVQLIQVTSKKKKDYKCKKMHFKFHGNFVTKYICYARFAT